MSTTDPVVAEDDPLLATAFMQEMARQLRGMDSHGINDALSAAQLLDPFVLTKERKQEIPIIGDPDEEIVARIKAYYNAIAVLIEQQTGLMAAPLVHLTYEGFGRVIITVGRLVVLDRSLRDVHRFGFKSLARMQEEGDRAVNTAVQLTQAHAAVAAL